MDLEARNRLVVDNLPLVAYLASDMCARATHLCRADLISAGALALVTAANSYNAELGVPFGAFARRRIQGAFLDELRAADWATRSARKRMKATLAVVDTLTSTLGRPPRSEEIAQALGTTRDEVDAALTDHGRTVSSLDEVTEGSLAARTPAPEDAVLDAEQRRYLRAAIEALPSSLRTVIEAIYVQGRTVKDLTAELGVSHAAISQRRAEGIKMLRLGLEAHYSGDAPGGTVKSGGLKSRQRLFLQSMQSMTIPAGSATSVPQTARGPRIPAQVPQVA